ncbi:protein-glutamate O-methyltransferase CheR [Paenibacillus tarimensis]
MQITREEFNRLSGFIERYFGIHLSDKKRELIVGRLHQVLSRKGFSTFSEYYEYIIRDRSGAAVAELVDKISTNHTFFMREADHFRFFGQTVLPELAASVSSKDLRIWSAGCSSGEEPYTLAMIISDFFGESKPMWDTKILATDLSGAVLRKAESGIYSNEQLEVLPGHWKKRYLRKLDAETSIVADKIRQEVIFRRFNLMETVFPFKKPLHVIFCRNVMIYFEHAVKMALLRKFYDHLAPGGYLFIGHSESFPRDQLKLNYVMPAVYRKGERM